MRIDPYSGSATQFYDDVRALSGHLRSGPLDPALRDLVEIRASQITGCAFCLQLHSGIARHRGVSETKLDTLAGWRESPTFSEKERSALGLVEAMTRIGDGARVDEEVWLAARETFNNDELISLLYLIGLINLWNRINVTVELPADYTFPL
jgi:AhpD family alkylhydroperoxidase